MGNFLTSPLTTKETATGADATLSFGVSAMQGWRTSMEDTHITALAPEGYPPGMSLFAVFDGHGGRLSSSLAGDLLAHILLDTFQARKYFVEHTPTPAEIGDALKEAFLVIDEEIGSYPEVKDGTDQSGCTAIAAVVTREHIIVANAGDSRSVLAKGGNTVPMSFDHKPMNESERKRIEAAGAKVSRALGDFTYKQRPDLPPHQQQVSPEPEITIEAVDGTEEFLLLACDGIWDVMTNDGICAFVRGLLLDGETNLGMVAEEILDHSLVEGSRDNMSAIVVQFPGAKFGSGEGVAGIRKIRKKKEEEAEARGERIEDTYGA
ncbi:hypothetical protein PybrP1_004507 [[Pythium] brassicae (nom. inval.)]|nr:hypothetical protein PybrP1_004507 [[Pythium] brassicae (nom. inval.)]